MASDDPAGHARVELPVRFDDASDLEGVQSHLNSLRKHRHFTPIASTANPPATSNSHKIYLERIRAERDTVDQDWFDSDPLVIEPTRSAPGSSRDRLRHVEHAVKLNVRRAGTKATDTLRKTKRSLFSSSRPKITLNDDIPLEAKADQDGLTSGVAIRPQRTNSTFNTITLPAFDSLARYRSTSSRSTLSSSNVDLASLPRARPRSPQSPGRGAPRVASPSSLSSVRNFDSYFPSSPPMHVQSDPASSLPPLSTATTRNNDEPSHPHRRTLTIDDYSPPSRRDTLASFLPSRHHPSSGPISGLFFNHHNKHALQTTTNSSSTSVSSASRPTTPPPAPSRGGKGVLTRSPTELTTMTTHTNSQKTRRRVAKEELQKLLLRRKKLLSRRARDDVDDENRILVPGEGDEETEGAKGAAGTKGIDKEIVERLKVLGALVEETERVETDVLWEHQRGLLVFGLPKFSSAALFQFDPSVWTDETLRSSPYTPHDFPCRPYWRWRDQEFMVDMGGDRDEEGWSYAVFFHSKNWRGEPSLFRSFVRRRRWVRTRIYIPLPPSNSSDPASSSSPLSLSTDPSSKRDSHRGGGRPTGEKFLAIDGTIAQDQEERDDDEVEVKDLKSACECLPLTREEKMALFYSATCSTSNSSSTLDGGLRGTKKARQLESVYIPPENPFIPFRIILEHARLRDHDVDEGDNECHEPGTADKRNQPGRELVWRQGIREINETRVKQVLKRVARIDRERLKLWKIWLNAPADPRRDVDDAEDDTAREKGFECQEWSEWRSSEKVTSWTEWLEEHRPEELRNEDDGEDDGRKMSWRIKEEVGEDVPPVESEDFASVNRADRSRGPEAGKSRPSSRQSRDGTGNRRGLDEEDEDVGRPDLEDVWDLIEARLDNVLALFDYHLTRLAFLRLVLACHPLASTPFPSSASSSSTQPSIRHDKDARQFVHRHDGYDLPFEARRHKLELEWEKRLRWVAGVKEEVERMEGGRGNSPPSPARTAAGGRVLELKKDENALQRTRSERRARKGKQRAIYVEG